MISRRQLRIKVLQTLYAYYQAENDQLNQAEKELQKNINKSYDLYHYLLIMIMEIADLAESRIEIAKKKRIPSREDLNPNTRFVENKMIYQLRHSDKLIRYADLKKLTWVDYPELIKEMYNLILEDEGFIEYMSQEESGYAEDKKIINRIFTNIILPNENLELLLEEQSIYWNDDLEFMISMIIKTVKRFKEDEEQIHLLDLYKNPEDKDFAIDLFLKSILNKSEYLEYIKNNTKNWDIDRIAFMDILIMQMAIAELIGFNSIPTKVTLNEYLEIAKYYSTTKSNVFINGVLDKVADELKVDNKISKTGRGLIGENNESE
jgi:transcription antitermination protein NusB